LGGASEEQVSNRIRLIADFAKKPANSDQPIALVSNIQNGLKRT